jgi:uncharacterized protein (TIGR02996 family)
MIKIGEDEKSFLDYLAGHPDDEATRLAYADWLDDHDRHSEAFAYRWAVHHGKRPQYIWEGNNDYPCWRWGIATNPPPEGEYFARLPYEVGIHLGKLVYVKGQADHPTIWQAYLDLAQALDRLRKILSIPNERLW